MYFIGQGVPRDPVTAHMWLNLAAAREDAGAGEIRDLVAESMSREQIAEAQSRATAWDASAGK